MRLAWVLLLTGIGLMGCKTLDRQNASPAVVTGFNQEGKAEIAEIVNQAMPGANVKLADDILSKDNRLFIQRKPLMVDGNPAQGRITEMPRKFELYRSDSACFLLDTKTDKDYLLKKVDCRPMD